MAVIDRLLDKGDRSPAEEMYLDALTDLVETYEEAHVAIPARSDVDGMASPSPRTGAMIRAAILRAATALAGLCTIVVHVGRDILAKEVSRQGTAVPVVCPPHERGADDHVAAAPVALPTSGGRMQSQAAPDRQCICAMLS
jgi:hypothetical protein